MIEYGIKNEAEGILQELGIPVSDVINLLYRQIIRNHGIPFSLTIPSEPRTLDSMTKEQLEAKLQHSYEQSILGGASCLMICSMKWKEDFFDDALLLKM